MTCGTLEHMFEPTMEMDPPEGLSSLDLEDGVVVLAGQQAAVEARVLSWLAAFEAKAGWRDSVMTATFCSYRLGWSPHAARERVAVARALPAFPKIRQAFSEGRISFPAVRAIIRVATPEIEEELVSLARECTGAMLGRIINRYRRLLAEHTGTEPTRSQHAARRLSYHFDDEGFFHLHGTFSPEAGAVIEAALDQAAAEAKDAEAHLEPEDSPASGTPLPWEARSADALVAVCESYRTHGAAARPGAARAEVVVHVDAAVLAGAKPDAESRCELEDHDAALAPEAARRIACDASVVAMIHDAEGVPLSVGRRTRTIPTPIRTALVARDRGCVFPGCGQSAYLEGHHIVHWAEGGETSLGNLALVCLGHHRAIHEGGYRITASPAGSPPTAGSFVFTRPDGTVVEPPDWDSLPTRTPTMLDCVTPTDALCHYTGGGLNLGDTLCRLYGVDGRFAAVSPQVLADDLAPPPTEPDDFPVENAWMYEEDDEGYELGPAHYDWENWTPPPLPPPLPPTDPPSPPPSPPPPE